VDYTHYWVMISSKRMGFFLSYVLKILSTEIIWSVILTRGETHCAWPPPNSADIVSNPPTHTKYILICSGTTQRSIAKYNILYNSYYMCPVGGSKSSCLADWPRLQLYACTAWNSLVSINAQKFVLCFNIMTYSSYNDYLL